MIALVAQKPEAFLKAGARPVEVAVPLEGNANYAALRQGLQDLGYVEGQNLALEYRVGADPDQYPQLIAALTVVLLARTPRSKNAAKNVVVCR